MEESQASVTDQALYERCLAGDETAWGYVYQYVLKLCSSPQWRLENEAEDMAQVIVKSLIEKGLQKVEHPENFRRFIKGLTVNRIKDSYKRKEVKYEVCVEDEILEIKARQARAAKSNPGPEHAVLQKYLIEAINKEILNLPDFCQKVMPGYFRYKLGLIESYQELSRNLDLPTGTISSYVYRCLKILRKSKALQAFLQGESNAKL